MTPEDIIAPFVPFRRASHRPAELRNAAAGHPCSTTGAVARLRTRARRPCHEAHAAVPR